MDLAPFTVLLPSEPFQAGQFLDQAKQALQGAVEHTSFETKKHPPADIVDFLNTYPMMGMQRLVMVDQNKELPEAAQTQVLDYVASPTAGTYVIWKLDKLDKRKKFYKTLLKQAASVSFEAPKLAQMSGFVDRLAKIQGVQVEREAKPLLIDCVGTDVSTLSQELTKLALYIHPRKAINKEDVFAMVLKVSGDDIFACTDAVIEGRFAQSIQTLHFLFESGVSPFVVSSMLARHLRILMKVHEGQARRVPGGKLASFAGVPPFVLKRYQQQLRQFGQDKAKRALKLLQQLDHDYKSIGLPQPRLLEHCVRRIIAL
jgi:DNA polymerase-3 subunit delta